ncbi:TadE/TadG family type IV pilus assembly protein [Pseudolabrys sp. FHR47]|uniref:TadE/TadG family type IV pilus assembly protein n=1 Tax=Pseudolabrys sp. FHR47 TaxID=2562284 RepID=UPI001FED3F8E|nr:TadE/TadG family type IV pilus assembly protein [Pseudolabrys sp. FHR47]
MKTMWNRLTDRLSTRLAAFRRDRRGNVAITFAIATLPMVGAVGYAVDYSHANNVKAALQAALDSTALMLAREATSLSSDQLSPKALTYFTALFNRPEAKNISIKATYTTDGGSKIVVDGSATVPTTFLGVIGYNDLTVGGSSTTAWGSTRLRVALALDNTGSMASDGKMTALKSATKDLLTQLKNAASQNGDVYVSIIPFAKDVNVGSINYNANWIDWTDWDSDNQTCSGWGWSYTCTTKNHNTWNGCITDRGPSNAPGNSTWDQVATLPDNTTISKWPAEQYSSCPVAMKGLTYDWTALNNLVDTMQPKGATNQPIGLVWAWQSLVGGGPLTAPAKDSNYEYSDIIILMSDGLNTQDRWYGNGSNTSTPVDNRMYQTGNGSGTCANIKQAGITIYTIHVNTDGDPTSTLLQNCAGSKDKMYDISKFFTVTSASGIAKVFNEIGTSLTQLRVAK